jgi:hypothetical protein
MQGLYSNKNKNKWEAKGGNRKVKKQKKQTNNNNKA